MSSLPQPAAGAGNPRFPARGVVVLLFLAISGVRAGPVELSPQLITLPSNAGMQRFADIDRDGRADLLVIDPLEKVILNFHQRPAGFTNSPDQAVPLPPGTAWIAPGDVDAHPGLELLFSTATGLVYSRQNAGRFESERHTLIEAAQVFTNSDFPILTLLATNNVGTNDLIPVISAQQVVLYHRNNDYEWSPGPPTNLEAIKTTWYVEPDQWTLGPNAARSLRVSRFFRTKPDERPVPEPDNEVIRKLIADLKNNPVSAAPITEYMDVDGDGLKDLVVWQTVGKMDFKTDIYLFLSALRPDSIGTNEIGRGAELQLPLRPTQILHCRGMVIPVGPSDAASPLSDLNGDGVFELVLIEPPTITSKSALLEMLLSHGVDWSLAIRSFHGGAFSRSPDATVPVTTIVSLENLGGWPIFIDGDFNGDGRPDLLVRRSETQWNIIYSTTDGRWFDSQPALIFDVPARGNFEITDLNGDGRDDIVRRHRNEHRLSIFMSPSPSTKGRNP